MKFWNYVMLTTGLALILELAGLPIASGLLAHIGITTTGLTIKTAALWVAIFGGTGILIGLGTGIAIGYITKSSPENFIILPLIIGSGTFFLSTLIAISSAAWGRFPIGSSYVWISYITTVLMGLLSVGFAISCVEFFRGTD